MDALNLIRSTPDVLKALTQGFLLSVLLELFVVLSPFYMQLVVDEATLKADCDLLSGLAVALARAAARQHGPHLRPVLDEARAHGGPHGTWRDHGDDGHAGTLASAAAMMASGPQAARRRQSKQSRDRPCPSRHAPFGPDATPVSLLGFGCGAVGGLMVRGAAADQERAVARAPKAGVNHFDTAVQYGDGAPERHLSGILRRFGAKGALAGTKVRLRPAEFRRIAAAVAASLDGNLRRRQAAAAWADRHRRDRGLAAGHRRRRVRQRPGHLQHAETLRPAAPCPPITRRRTTPSCSSARAGRMSASSASACRPGAPSAAWPIATPSPSPEPEPIGSALSHKADLGRAARLMPLVGEGFAASLPEAAIRFAIAHPAMGTILVGMASVDEFEAALAAVLKGPLPAAALRRVAELAAGFSGESR